MKIAMKADVIEAKILHKRSLEENQRVGTCAVEIAFLEYLTAAGNLFPQLLEEIDRLERLVTSYQQDFQAIREVIETHDHQ